MFAENIKDGIAVISGGDAAHLIRVLRVKVGDDVRVMYEGKQYDGRVQSVAENISVANLFPVETPPFPARITLYQGIPKLAKMETVIQKSVELGVHKIIPTVCSRCVAKADAHKIDRWRKISAEACKQCGRADVPEVTSCLNINRIENTHGLLIIAYEEETKTSLKRVLTDVGGICDIGLVIGPEGGLGAGEVEYLKSIGGRSVSLGGTILRTETAGPAALAMINYHYGE